ncbi:TetR/AcrR family transcriptional regulator [Mycolicibacterium mucogenicum]|uniref:TetR/AcrR family transcriptional regulator n=1 Tax=Mycolicibacterium mucogenicum DSM 44124 TaxID=1226753 RepID=A0A8H2PF53_MYCMU|nr:TetR/AcrR family transcriptional regulator [Mycolicibacterium mucogenicum]KAB7761105.1 TetR family transcriptional regulator [Mycolicibacterium mucogenicum DSM 44124]QPG69911.1 TetR/AcrR family transcriptional regulator [Mycolicibacterium mucogenicum DSM 44124]
MAKGSYHHGDLKAVILEQAAALVAERGADGISLRELARVAGVSHAAPAHHFSDRRGLFTALATEGFTQLAAALTEAEPEFAHAARAYVQFALDHPGHYAVMFDKMLYDADDPALRAAEAEAAAELTAGVATLVDPNAQNDPDGSALAAWSLVHGFALLTLNGAVTDADPVDTAERLARILFSG